MGPELAQEAYVSIRATFVMADVSATGEPLQGLLTKPVERVTIGMCMALELKLFFTISFFDYS